MSLDDLLNETEDTEAEKPSSLFNVSRVKFQKDKLHKEEICPGCGSSNTEEVAYYWRCLEPREKCEIITYIPSNHTLSEGLYQC